MDVVFDAFNSATLQRPGGYPPAARQSARPRTPRCSTPVPAQCQLFANLQALGFQNELAMNHDGHFDDFIGDLTCYGGLAVTPLPIEGYPRALDRLRQVAAAP